MKKAITLPGCRGPALDEEGLLEKELPGVLAESWVLFDPASHSVFRGLNCRKKRQIASLTKIMTCVCALQVVQLLQLNSATVQCEVTLQCTLLGGTSAGLRVGELLTLDSLLHGVMLPSGNDAAQLLAECLGYLLYKQEKSYTKLSHEIISLSEQKNHLRLYSSKFLSLMNQKARQLRMGRTVFDNVHGLPNKSNLSCALDIAVLCKYASEITSFRKIVVKKEYECRLTLGGQARLLTWVNTNQLLGNDCFKGIKTGHSAPAGGCLASWVRQAVRGKVAADLLIVVLGSSDTETRFQDTILLKDYYVDYLANL